jgi:hypothetical protein
MATEKISATLDRDVLDEIRRTVGPRRLSAFLSQAAREKLHRARVLAYLGELDAEFGPLDARAKAVAARRLAHVLTP